MRLTALLAALVVATSAVFADDAVPVVPPAPDAAQAEVADEAPAVEAETAPAPVAEPAAAAPAPVATAPKIVVFLPERVDLEWCWNYYADNSQHLMQSAVEKALIAAGFEVIDLASIRQLEAMGSLETLTSAAGARAAAQRAGADLAVFGTATAVKAGEGLAYGVPVVRANAEITAKILRVSDGKILDVLDASAEEGGQASRAACQAALKKAAPGFARKLAAAAKRVSQPQP